MAFASLLTAGQEGLQALLTRPAPNCWDIEYNAREHLPRLLRAGEPDSTAAILSFWRKHCGRGEPIDRISALLAIQRGEFRSEQADSIQYAALFEYRKRNYAGEAPSGQETRNDVGNASPYITFDRMTEALADSLLAAQGARNRDEEVLLLFYGNRFEEGLAALRRGEGRLAGFYRREVKDLLGRWAGDGGFIFGTWHPFGNLELLGNHPALGFYLGAAGRRLGVAGVFYFKFLEAEHPYQVMFRDTLHTTRNFFGGYIGLDARYDLFKVGRLTLGPAAGLALDGFDALEGGDGEGKDNGDLSLWSHNLNAGAQARLQASGISWTLEIKHAWLHYGNQGGTDLDGSAVTALIKLGIGGTAKQMRLQALGYREE